MAAEPLPSQRRRRWWPQPVLSAALLVLWLLLVNSIAPGHVLLGAVFGFLVPLFTRNFWPDPPRIRRPGLLLRLVLRVLADIVLANLSAARLILGPRRALRPGFLEVPLELSEPFAITVLTSIISLTPGTVSCQLSPDRKRAWVHSLHVEDAEHQVQRVKQRYERPLLEIFQ